MKLLFNNEWLRSRIESDPDLDCEAGVPEAVTRGDGIIKNGRYFNTGKTYNPDGTLRFDFDASNARDPWFNGDTFHGYDEEGCPIWNKAK